MDDKEKSIDNLKEYRDKLANLTEEEKKLREAEYLRGLGSGEIQGPLVGYPEIDKTFLGLYSSDEINEEIPKKTVWQYTKDCLSAKDDENLKVINYYGTSINWEQFKNIVDDIADRLAEQYNIQKGDKVSLCLPTMPETFYLFFALNKIGAIANMVDPRINEERIKNCIGQDSKLVFGIDRYNEKIDKVTRELNINNVISVSGAASLSKIKKTLYHILKKAPSISRLRDWEDFKKNKVNFHTIDVEYSQNMPAAIVYTSGTTGIPKGAILTNDSLNAVSYQQKKVLPDMKKGDTFLDIMPPFLAYGLACGICAPLSTGLNLTLIPEFKPDEFSDLVMKNKSNHILGVPTFFESLTKNKKIKSLDFIKYCIAGGDKMTVESENRINDFFSTHGVKNKIVKGYGMTELSSGVFINHDNDHNKLGSCGTPLIKNKVKVVDPETGKNLPYNTTGEIYVSGPSEMYGYSNNSEEQEKIMKTDEYGEIWVKTGDLGHVDENSNVTIDGRSKNMIVRPDGHNVFPATIEDVILQHPAVDACIVVGISSKEYQNGKIPTACIVLKEEYKGLETKIAEEINKMSLEKLPPRDVALDYKFFDELPLTMNGKNDIIGLIASIENDTYNEKRR